MHIFILRFYDDNNDDDDDAAIRIGLWGQSGFAVNIP